MTRWTKSSFKLRKFDAQVLRTAGTFVKSYLEALDDHFLPKTNDIYERYISNTADQISNVFLNDQLYWLQELAKHCQFGDKLDEIFVTKSIILKEGTDFIEPQLLWNHTKSEILVIGCIGIVYCTSLICLWNIFCPQKTAIFVKISKSGDRYCSVF